MSGDPSYWVLEPTDPTELIVNPDWVGLVSEDQGGVIAMGQPDVIASIVELLNTCSGVQRIGGAASRAERFAETGDTEVLLEGLDP